MDNAINISLTFKDIGMFVLWVLLSGVLLYILMILIRFYKSFKDIMKIVDDKRPEIDAVIDELPGITQNVNAISGEVAHVSKAFHNTVDNLAETSDNVTEAIAEKSGMAGKVSSVMHTVAIIKTFYEEYFAVKEAAEAEEEDTVMVCKEVPKSSVELEKDPSQNKDDKTETI